MKKTAYAAIGMIVMVVIISALLYYSYNQSNSVWSVVDSAYREYKWNYVAKAADNLNNTNYFLNNDSSLALLSIDYVLSTFRGSWSPQVLSAYSTDYNTLFNTVINGKYVFGDSTGYIYSCLYKIRNSIYYGNVTDEQENFLIAAANTYQIFSIGLMEPQGHNYNINNVSSVTLMIYNLGELARQLP